jgi:hypothetical protein
MVRDTNSAIPNISAISSSLVFSQMGSREDSRHPLKPLIANFYHVILTTIMVVNTGGASPAISSASIHCAGNFDQGSKPVVQMWS